MHLKFLPTSLPLTLAALVLSAGLPFSTVIFNPCSSVAQAARTSGIDGSNGSSGANGETGRSGRDATVEATEQPVEIDISGASGGPGSSGENGERANCDNHNRPDTNVEAADGGDGGNGGNGGSGGNGGNVTVYYQNRDYLRNVYVNAAGGDGGQGGYSGNGSQGCNCSEYNWSVTTCPDGNCTTNNFSCTDGEDGDDGSHGSRGASGQTGKARLVDQSIAQGDRLQADNPKVESAIASLSTTPISLSRNLWEIRTGAQSLFANDSVIDDEYEAYTGRVEKQVQFVWEATRPQSAASGEIEIALNEQGEFQVTSLSDLWINGELSEAEDLLTYRIKSTLLESEAAQLSLGRRDGQGQQLKLNVIDNAGTSDLVETSFHVRYQVSEGERDSRFTTRYEAEIPRELISQNYNLFTLALGQLPIDSKYVQAGTQAKIEITVTRTYAGNTATKVLRWDGEL
jgi:hypothetical protein